MIKKSVFLIGLMGLTIGSCIDHEVIPPPEPTVDLICSFEGNIGGAFVEYTENVNGYTCTSDIRKQTQSGITDAQYLFAMTSQEQIPFVQIALGSLTWNDANGTQIPALSLFNAFFLTNDNPEYSNAALDGFEASYRDIYGDTWRSYKDSIPESVAFSGITQESDNNGDYSKFVCTFSCPVYCIYEVQVIPATVPVTYRDSVVSMMIEDAIYHGYFKR
ncbi:MAG: hypothetical protein QNK23_14550 [Crocinitomicaceae bacterium]|nr:hypothetical protein [Crocinitomicaceae bacterium]